MKTSPRAGDRLGRVFRLEIRIGGAEADADGERIPAPGSNTVTVESVIMNGVTLSRRLVRR